MMPLIEIADLLDEAANSLVLLAQAVAGPGNEEKARFELRAEVGRLIDLRAIASDVRRHAALSA